MMLKMLSILRCLCLLLILILIQSCEADVGNAAHYGPPYIPTACFGGDAGQFPSSNLFGAAGEGIWDNGAACGRNYIVRCLSAVAPRTCNPEQTVQIKIVDRAQTSISRPSAEETSLVLSETAFRKIAKISAPLINVEFQQV